LPGIPNISQVSLHNRIHSSCLLIPSPEVIAQQRTPHPSNEHVEEPCIRNCQAWENKARDARPLRQPCRRVATPAAGRAPARSAASLHGMLARQPRTQQQQRSCPSRASGYDPQMLSLLQLSTNAMLIARSLVCAATGPLGCLDGPPMHVPEQQCKILGQHLSATWWQPRRVSPRNWGRGGTKSRGPFGVPYQRPRRPGVAARHTTQHHADRARAHSTMDQRPWQQCPGWLNAPTKHSRQTRRRAVRASVAAPQPQACGTAPPPGSRGRLQSSAQPPNRTGQGHAVHNAPRTPYPGHALQPSIARQRASGRGNRLTGRRRGRPPASPPARAAQRPALRLRLEATPVQHPVQNRK
jgi:hypothetical protein